MHANIDVHSRIFIAEFAVYGIKYIEKLQSYCANMTFVEKVGTKVFYNKSHIKEGNLQWITLNYSKIHWLYQFL